MKVVKEFSVCGGRLIKLSHNSNSTKTSMNVNIYLPKHYYAQDFPRNKRIPTVFYLSGLTCTPDNASEKAFWQFQADKYGFAIVFPDTSPRGDEVANDPEGSWDFGQGAGFYLNATQEPYAQHYQMYDYIHKELPQTLDSHFNKNGDVKLDFLDNVAITGHSMGGYGAIYGYLKGYSGKRYKSCSAFAPIVNPSNVPWGQKAFKGYLGEEKAQWEAYDPCLLIKNIRHVGDDRILIHVGDSDPFLEEHLKPELLLEAVKATSWQDYVEIKKVHGFDHSYYFVSTFVPEHAEFHARNLGLI
ncbi:hypothetical protein H784_YJM1202J00147 [Saccharomyces cerevisiae YJM1202]|nr:hypothetical protein H766_YJM681J00147 [Saccharomyces cerevisiae YJM681]AJR59132.1 hypothetical protein H781_YJM1133J00147 [Saccharomyces cerevisiae YJM1133]AJR66244.1 hypothetical protein H784_YJM1202J00147 [Saccharomyces cerevisiae YJM1202]